MSRRVRGAHVERQLLAQNVLGYFASAEPVNRPGQRVAKFHLTLSPGFGEGWIAHIFMTLKFL